jgi:glycosyltransferase involved in cell wall biosynthesis
VNLLSKTRKPKIWMNITSSLSWDRPAVGVIRVEQELRRALIELYGGEFGLCVFSGTEFIPYEENNSNWPVQPTVISMLEANPPIKNFDFPRSSVIDRVFSPVKTVDARGSSSVKDAEKIADRDILYGDIILSAGLDWNHSYVDEFRDLRIKKGIKIVTVCHDIIPVVAPQYCASDVASHFTEYFTKLSWASSVILCFSKCSRDDYLKVMTQIGAPKAETVVVPLGDNVFKRVDLGRGDENISEQVQQVAAEPFILFVSTIDRRKNHEVLYRAYNLLARDGYRKQLPKLVFVGMPGWGVGDFLKDMELDPLTEGLIVQLNNVTDDELGFLYEKADFCAYPSLYEGWGLPVGEALARGKAVIASAGGSIPEVGGDLVTYLDPWNPRAWADEIRDLVNRPERVRLMEAAVRKDYRVRTWQDTAKAVKLVLDTLREAEGVAVTLYPGYDLYSMVGTAFAQATCSTGAAGPLTHGPYRTLPVGTYEVAVALDKLKGVAGKLRCSMRSDQGRKEHGAVEVSFDEQEHFDLVILIPDIEIDVRIDDYEIYTEITENLLVAVNRIDIKSVTI